MKVLEFLNLLAKKLLVIAIFEKMLFMAIVPFQEIEIFSKQNFSKCLDLMIQTFFIDFLS